MQLFIDYRQEQVKLAGDVWEHIHEEHADVSQELIANCLRDPDEIRQSRKKSNSELYYLLRQGSRYTCVIVKRCSDGNFIETAMTTSTLKEGKALYKKA